MEKLDLQHVEDDVDEIIDAILHGFDTVPIPTDVAPYHAVPLAIALRSEEGKIEGGITGHSVWDWLYVKYLWVAEARRGCGYGKRLLDATEHEAEKRGCRGVWLNTLSFQAPEFYERQGYQRFGTLDDFPKGHRRVFYQKSLKP